jgi:hypothetical protein
VIACKQRPKYGQRLCRGISVISRVGTSKFFVMDRCHDIPASIGRVADTLDGGSGDRMQAAAKIWLETM